MIYKFFQIKCLLSCFLIKTLFLFTSKSNINFVDLITIITTSVFLYKKPRNVKA